jgi:hypothetical protein
VPLLAACGGYAGTVSTASVAWVPTALASDDALTESDIVGAHSHTGALASAIAWDADSEPS